MAANVSDYLKFFESKRALYVDELSAVAEDFVSSRVYEDMYSKDDVNELIDKLLADMQASVKTSLTSTIQMGAAIANQLIASADNQGIGLSFDLEKSDDASVLARFSDLTFTGDGKEDDADAKRGVKKLASIRDEHQKLMTDLEALRAENKTLLERTQATMRAHAEVVKARNEASEAVEVREAEIASLKAQVQTLMAKAGSGGGAGGDVTHKAISQSKQFQRMRDMLQSKNKLVNELRAKLAKYEPDDDAVAVDDDDAGHK